MAVRTIKVTLMLHTMDIPLVLYIVQPSDKEKDEKNVQSQRTIVRVVNSINTKFCFSFHTIHRKMVHTFPVCNIVFGSSVLLLLL